MPSIPAPDPGTDVMFVFTFTDGKASSQNLRNLDVEQTTFVHGLAFFCGGNLWSQKGLTGLTRVLST